MGILTKVINAFKKSFVVDNPFENELKRTLSWMLYRRNKMQVDQIQTQNLKLNNQIWDFRENTTGNQGNEPIQKRKRKKKHKFNRENDFKRVKPW